jgi:hypothetical protein
LTAQYITKEHQNIVEIFTESQQTLVKCSRLKLELGFIGPDGSDQSSVGAHSSQSSNQIQSTAIQAMKRLTPSQKIQMGINQERFIQYYIQELLTHLQNENQELRNKVQHYQEVVNQNVTQSYLQQRLAKMAQLTKQAQSYIILTQKLKQRTDSFISQNLDQQISNVKEISKIC